MGCEAGHYLPLLGATASVVARLWSYRSQAALLESRAVHEVASSNFRGIATYVAA